MVKTVELCGELFAFLGSSTFRKGFDGFDNDNAVTQFAHVDQSMVNRKGLSAAFLPKCSAEIWQKDNLIRNALSVFLQKEAVSAERGLFGRNSLQKDKNPLSVDLYTTSTRCNTRAFCPFSNLHCHPNRSERV